MGEYEPNDSRNITLSNDNAPGEPPRTGPREGETRNEGEKGVRAAPRPGTTPEPRSGPLDEGEPSGDPQASQAQWQGGQSQATGGLSQLQGSFYQQVQEPSASLRAEARGGQLGDTGGPSSAPTQQEAGSAGNAGWAADFPSDQAEAASGHSGQQRQEEPASEPDTERTRREQAAGQGSPQAPQGFGYGAEGEEEMSDAPDASDLSQRGYGGAGEARMKKIQGDS